MPDYKALLAQLDPSLRESHPEIVRALEQAAADQELLDQWQRWMQTEWDAEHGMTRAEWELRQRLSELEKRFQPQPQAPGQAPSPASLRIPGFGLPETPTSSAGPAPRTPESPFGYRPVDFGSDFTQPETEPKQDILKVIEEKTKSVAETLASAFGAIVPRLLDAQAKHIKEFGEPLEGSSLWKFMVENNLTDPVDAYERLVADKRAERAKREMEEKIREAEQRGREQALKEVAMSSKKLPTDDQGVPPAALLRQQKEEARARLPEGIKLGQGRLAEIAAQEFSEKTGS